jgi:predicted nucleotidyltransferase
MRVDDPNLAQLRRVARALGDLREQFLFVGGAVASLLLTDPLTTGVRPTDDVDAIVDAGRAAFAGIERRLRERGFEPDATSEVICRWIHRESGIPVDIMPVDADVLGFTNRWYRYAAETANSLTFDDDMTIRLISAVAFIATKLEAFADRGRGDILASHDLEDVLTVIDGREELPAELAAAPEPVRAAITSTVTALLGNPDFLNALPGLLADPERSAVVIERMHRMR